MARIVFTSQLQRFLEAPEVQSSAATLRGALEECFACRPRLRGYILDDQGHLRSNVVIFVDGRRVANTALLDDPLEATSTVHVLQALSGG